MARRERLTANRIAILGGSLNPPGHHHLVPALALAKKGFHVIVVPCGPRPDKETVNDTDPIHRATMADLTFQGVHPAIEVDHFDLENDQFTPNGDLEKRYAGRGEVWHAVGADLVRGGKNGESAIQRYWHHGRELWEHARFVIIRRRGYRLDPEDLPPYHLLVAKSRSAASEKIRARVFGRKAWRHLVTPGVADYIERHELYRGRARRALATMRIKEPNVLVIADQLNPRSRAVEERVHASVKPEDARSGVNLVVAIGGDATMLRAIREHWRLRAPFFGINTGHVGFLLNDVADAVSRELFAEEMMVRTQRLLHVTAYLTDGDVKHGVAFNDAWVQAEIGKTAHVEVIVDGIRRYEKLVGDGALVSTAAGSTASARAMGARPIPVESDQLVLVGSNILFPLDYRGAVYLGAPSTIEFRNADATGWRKLYGIVDGEVLGTVARLVIRQSRVASVDILHTAANDPREKVARVQFSR